MASVTFDTENMSQNKSVLAKLLASENINIVQKKMETAAFDLKTRTLFCPIWEAMDGDMYDLLMGHEVGHALYTPCEGWHDALDAKAGGVSKSILNVVEDARIEKLMKRKYPGLSRPMLRAYKQLNDRDFFGIKKLSNFSKLNFADRLNLHYKLGAFNALPFSEEERPIVIEIDNAESWDDVVAISRKVQSIMKANKDQDQDTIQSLDDLINELRNEEKQDLDGEEGDSEDSSDFDDQEDESEDDDKTGEGSPSQDDDDEDSDESDDADDGQTTGSAKDADNADEAPTEKKSALEQLQDKIAESEEPEALTDQIFRARENELVVDNLEVIHVDFPQAVLKNIVEPVTSTLATFVNYTSQFNASDYSNMLSQQQNRFLKNNDKFIQQLVKQFMMKRNASQYARQLEARTGELDMSKLHKYKFTNDIFSKIKVVPKGKSHGLVVFIDMSGSMTGILGPTFEQMLILGTFCKRVNIPFDFYGFCDSHQTSKISSNKFTSDNLIFSGKSFHLKHLLSSTFSPKLYKAAFDMLLNVSYYTYSYNAPTPSTGGFELNGTPLIQTIVAARTILEEFKSKHKLDIVNAMYLTDGDGTDEPHIVADDRSRGSFNSVLHSKYKDTTNKRIIKMTDRKTKITITCNSSGDDDYNLTQQIFTMMVQKITKCVNIGFYIGYKSCIRNRLTRHANNVSAEVRRQMNESMRRNNFYTSDNAGFASYFNVCMRNENINNKFYSVDATNNLDKKAVKKLSSDFSKTQNSKKTDRIFTSKLMDFLC